MLNPSFDENEKENLDDNSTSSLSPSNLEPTKNQNIAENQNFSTSNPGLAQSSLNSENPDAPRWYVLRVQTSKEDKVKSNLEARIQSMEMADRIFRVLVPTEKVVDPKRTKRVTYRKMYPGYVMVEMIKTEQTHYMVKNTPGVGDFAGVMSDAEVERMLLTCEHSKEKPQNKTPSFYKNQQVKIKEGIFEGCNGVVEEVNEAAMTLKVNVQVFGRFTEVELAYRQVEDISNSTTT